MGGIRTRFAPSPTGRMHMGNVRTALLCWHHARSCSGKVLLRIDDTDVARSEVHFIDAIKSDLAWLGLKCDDLFHQSSRRQRYDEISDILRGKGLLYPCYETKDELEYSRKVLLKRGVPPIYRRDKGSIDLSKRSGRDPHWRFDLTLMQKMFWVDIVKGPIEFSVEKLSDPIVIREDGSYTYMLPSVIDDVDYAITDVIRGDDHVTNTAVQLAMFQALDASVPRFAHVPLLRSNEQKLSKRSGSMSIDSVRDMGISVEAIYSYILSLGSSKPQIFTVDFAEHITNFSLDNYGKSACIFSLEDMIRTNQYVLRHISWPKLKDEFADLIKDSDCNVWNAVRDNISLVSEFKDWNTRFFGKFESMRFSDDELVIISRLRDSLVNVVWEEQYLKEILMSTGKEFGVKKTMVAARKALVGAEVGPEIIKILLAINKDHAISSLDRLVGAL